MPSYNKALLDCENTVKRYQEEYDAATGWNRYMLGQRRGDYVYNYTLQRMNIHFKRMGVFGDNGDYEVCSCGLKNYSKQANHSVGGHLFAGEPESRIIIDLDDDDGYVLFCQKCEETFPIISHGVHQRYGLPDVDAEATLAIHSGCTGEKQAADPDAEKLSPADQAFLDYEKRGGPIRLPLINQEPEEIAFRESFRIKPSEDSDGE